MTTSYTFLPWTRRGLAAATASATSPNSSDVEPITAAALEGT
jgi:hypothetical protein